MNLQYIPAEGPAFGALQPEFDTLTRMQALRSWVLIPLLLLWGAGAQADVYQDVHRLILSEQWPQALSQAEDHLKTRPTDPQMRLLLSRIQDGQGRTSAAMETLQALTQSYPELPEPHNNLAAMLARQNRYAEALTQLQDAVRARPDYATALENLGDVYVALAMEAYQNASKAPGAQARAANKRLAAEQLLKSAAP
jgi:tetratricopeptide (TPR) repeat protein